MFAAILAAIGPLVAPLAKLFETVFTSWVSYKAGSAAQKAATTEAAIEQHRRLNDVAESRADVDLDERRRRLREHFRNRP